MQSRAEHDVIIIGGGPAGATSGLLLARAGVRALVLEKATFPRFHLGESLLPRNFPLLVELGLEDAVHRLPHVPKFGVEFAMGDGLASASFSFDQGLLPGSPTVNLERAPFDQMLLNAARQAGADVREGAGVKRIVRLTDGDVAVEVDGQIFSGRYLIDASGQSTVVARHLGTRRPSTDRRLQKIAYFAQFQDVKRAAGRQGGNPQIVVCEEGWFWIIPLDERRTSIGLVLDAAVARDIGVNANRILAWGIERCPAMRDRMGDASGPATNDVTADFSYICRPYAGPGYFLVGDAAAFLDPIFSTGVTLAMLAGQRAAEVSVELIRGDTSAGAARKNYQRFITAGTSIFFRLIRQFYDHSFRELFLHGVGPMRVHNAVLSVLAGQVFPKPVWALRWRLRLFELLMVLNRYVPMVPRRNRFSLLAADVESRGGAIAELATANPASRPS